MRWKRSDPWPTEHGPLIVAIDGPAGVGKSTVGSLVADRLGATFLDTGVLYRAVTLAALEQGISPDDGPALGSLAQDLPLRVRRPADPAMGASQVLLGGREVTSEIRSPEVDAHVSEVSAHPEVRQALIPLQRRAADAPRAVVVGRDIGTVIFPDADLKIYLEATESERARRRARQAGSEEIEEVRRRLAHRDTLDRARPRSPLGPAPDAIVIETDGVAVNEVVDRICRIALAPAAS